MANRTPPPSESEALVALTAAVNRLSTVLDSRLVDLDAGLWELAEQLGDPARPERPKRFSGR